MVAIEEYKPSLHDLYLYEPEASFNRQAGEKIEGIPIGYNPKCYTELLQDYPVDFTGLAVLPRRYNNKCTRNNAVNNGWEDEWDADQASEDANINFYNSGYFAMMLVSPKHVAACKHYWTAAQNQLGKVVTFMNKEGKKFETTFIPPPPENQFNDTVILELRDEVPADLGIRIYNKVPVIPATAMSGGYKGWLKNTLIFTKSPQGAIWQTTCKQKKDVNGNPISDCPDCGSSNFNLPVKDKINRGLKANVWSGDSGSPAFMVSKQHGTLLVTGRYGGPVPSAKIDDDGLITPSSDFLKMKEILESFGYTYEIIEIFDAVRVQIQQRSTSEKFETVEGHEGQKIYCDVKIIGKDNTVVEESSNVAFSTITGVTPKIQNISIPPSRPNSGNLGAEHTNEGLRAFINIQDNAGSYPSSTTTVTWTIDDEEYNDLEDTLEHTFIIPDNTAGKTLKASVILSNPLGSDSETITYGEIEPRGYKASLTNPTFTPNPPVRGQSCTFDASIDDGEPYGAIWNWAIYTLDKNSAPSVKLAGVDAPDFVTEPLSSAFPVTFTIPDSDIPVGNRLILIGTIRNAYDRDGESLEIYSADVVES